MELNRPIYGEILFETAAIFTGVALTLYIEVLLLGFPYSILFSKTEYLFYMISTEALISLSTFGLIHSYYSCARFFPPRSLKFILFEISPLVFLLFSSSIPFFLKESQLLVGRSFYIGILNLVPILIVVTGSLFLFIVGMEPDPSRSRPTVRRQFKIIIYRSAISYITVVVACILIILLSHLISLSTFVQFTQRFFNEFSQLIENLFRLILEVFRKMFAL